MTAPVIFVLAGASLETGADMLVTGVLSLLLLAHQCVSAPQVPGDQRWALTHTHLHTHRRYRVWPQVLNMNQDGFSSKFRFPVGLGIFCLSFVVYLVNQSDNMMCSPPDSIQPSASTEGLALCRSDAT